jgi:hypothetical protein
MIAELVFAFAATSLSQGSHGLQVPVRYHGRYLGGENEQVLEYCTRGTASDLVISAASIRFSLLQIFIDEVSLTPSGEMIGTSFDDDDERVERYSFSLSANRRLTVRSLDFPAWRQRVYFRCPSTRRR